RTTSSATPAANCSGRWGCRPSAATARPSLAARSTFSPATWSEAMPPTDALRQAMEQSLAANPDDLATHMAYADHLVELGDPRGEFIQVQLALEDPRRS